MRKSKHKGRLIPTALYDPQRSDGRNPYAGDPFEMAAKAFKEYDPDGSKALALMETLRKQKNRTLRKKK